MLSSITFLSSFYRFGFATTNDRTRPVGPIHQSLSKTDASHPNVEAKDSSSVDLCFAKSLIHSPLHRRRWRPLVNSALRLRCLNAFAIGALTHSVNASRRFTAAEWQRTKSYPDYFPDFFSSAISVFANCHGTAQSQQTLPAREKDILRP